MLGTRIVIKRGAKEEAEKPFWISFSDLMSALMVMFLVVMSVALLAVTKKVSEEEMARIERGRDIISLLQQIKDASVAYPEITVDFDRKSINYGSLAEFGNGDSHLTGQQAIQLRKFVPEVVLTKANDALGKKWLKRIVVEGFTSQTGSYLYNLNLSLERSQRVICVLLETPLPGETPLTADQKEDVRDLFFVGGYSFNLAKASPIQSRRFEMRLEFLDKANDQPPTVAIPSADFGTCRI